jgi:sialic acid synthase SpsE
VKANRALENTGADTKVRQIPFGDRVISDTGPAIVVAEIGINHEGDLASCLSMIDAAADAGADAIKLQTADPDENYVPGSESHSLYTSAFLGEPETRAAFVRAHAQGMEAFTTTGLSTLDWIERLDPACYKISSSTLLHLPLIRRCAETGRSLILSTGMATAEDVDAAVSWVRSCGVESFVLMQCTSLYPAKSDTLDLAVIPALQKRYNVPVGFSDHSLGIDASPIAVALGARVIEKHFTLDPTREGFDHGISLAPSGFADMVEKIRTAEAMLGHREKRLLPEVAEVAKRMKRSLVARQEISAGSCFSIDNVGVMRVGRDSEALSPRDYFDLLGRTASRKVARWAPIVAEDLAAQPETPHQERSQS